MRRREDMNLKLTIGILTIAMMAIPGIAVTQETDGSTHTATGCLGKSPTANIYMITDEDGKLWDLRSETVPLGAHVASKFSATTASSHRKVADSNRAICF